MSIEKKTAPIFGLTGGMGSGKSTVSSRLSELGAEVFDADAIVKDLQKPGEPGHTAMVGIFGEDFLTENEELDRKKIASRMFADNELLESVNRVIHPMVWETMFEGASKLDEDKIALFDVPLLEPKHTENMLGVVVVSTSVDVAVERLKGRGYSPEEAKTRINSQMSNEDRIKMADYVIKNNEGLEELELQISKAWKWMLEQHQLS